MHNKFNRLSWDRKQHKKSPSCGKLCKVLVKESDTHRLLLRQKLINTRGKLAILPYTNPKQPNVRRKSLPCYEWNVYRRGTSATIRNVERISVVFIDTGQLTKSRAVLKKPYIMYSFFPIFLFNSFVKSLSIIKLHVIL